MCWGIVLKIDGTTELVTYPPREPEHLAYIREQVGGWAEYHDLPALHATMWMDEDGKMKQRPVNVIATALLRSNQPHFGNDFVVGDVLIVGPTDSKGIWLGLTALEADLVEAAIAAAN